MGKELGSQGWSGIYGAWCYKGHILAKPLHYLRGDLMPLESHEFLDRDEAIREFQKRKSDALSIYPAKKDDGTTVWMVAFYVEEDEIEETA